MFISEAMTFKLGVAVNEQIDLTTGIVAEAWTNVRYKGMSDGDWHSIPLDLIRSDQVDGTETVTVTFGNSVILNNEGKFHFTFRLKYMGGMASREGNDLERSGFENNDWVWASDTSTDGSIIVRPPSKDEWTKGPSFSQIDGPVHLGNFMAASIADQYDFDAVLNVADSVDLVTSKFTKQIDYQKIPIEDGTINPIDPGQIEMAVDWIKERTKTCSKILVNCRAGSGRAGSVMLSYVFAVHPTMTYEQAYDFVSSRRTIRPHMGLRETLYKLYPREQCSSSDSSK